MSEVPLNKFEKRDLIIKLHKEGKTYRDICSIGHVSPRDIKPILKEYERKKGLGNNKRKENTHEPTTKKLSKSSQAFVLYQEGKKIDEVKVLLDMPFKFPLKYWAQFLKSIRLYEAYEFYKDHSYDIPTFLSINTFMKRNNMSGKEILNVLRTANDVINLNQTIINLKTEIEKLKQIKNNMQYSQYNQLAPLKPLPKPNYWNYQYTNNLL